MRAAMLNVDCGRWCEGETMQAFTNMSVAGMKPWDANL